MFIFYDTRSLTETAWFWKCAKTQMTIHFAKDSWSVRQMPKAGVIVDVITMKIYALPCIIRIQSRPSGRSPICRHGKIWRFVGVVSKTGTFLKPTQQWNFSFFLFSAKRGGTSPNVQGRLSCWFDQLENVAFRLNISSFHKIPWRMHHQIDGNLLMRVRMTLWCDPCANV